MTSEMALAQKVSQEQPALLPLKNWHGRKTFATPTLKQLKSRLQYYRRILSQTPPTDPKKIAKREKIQRKYDRDMKVRNLLNRAVSNLYS